MTAYSSARIRRPVFVGPAAILTNDRHPRSVNVDSSPKDGDDWEPIEVTIGEGASLGAGSICVAPVRIGRWSLVGAGAVLTADVPDFALMLGTPARRVGWVGRAGEALVADEQGDGRWVCPQTGARFVESGDVLREETA